MMIDKPAGMLTLPRELRDKLYTYLLSTEYNRHECEWPRFDTGISDYTYRFHTSILYTNRQINHEASQTFYMNNLLVYVKCDAHLASLCNAHWRPILAFGAAPQSEHHAMKMEVWLKGESFSKWETNHFIITCNELPRFCRGLLLMDSRNKGSLASMDFRLIISDGVGTDGARTQDEATEYPGIIQGCPARGDPAIEESLANKKNTTGTTNLRVRRLLEPLRQLHSIHSPQIIGPLSEEYKAEVIADITKTLPSDQELFDHVLTTSEKAINNPDSGDSASSILDLKNTVVELDVARRLIKDIYTELITGPYAGVTIWEAYEDIEFLLSTKLAWAYLKTGDVRTAHRWLCLIIRSVVDSRRECWKVKLGGHKIAMFFYLKSQVLEGWDRISGHDRDCHCYCLPETVKALRQGLRHEPGNRVLAQELEKKELELAKEKEIDDLINMAYRLGFVSNLEILEDHWYIPGWIWNQKG